MNENDRELLEGLRSLAADGQQGAPLRVEERLLAEFQRRTRVRRAAFWSSGIAAIAATLTVMMFLGSKQHAPVIAQTGMEANMIEVPGSQGETAMSFYPLPEASELPPVENATIVRVALPVSSLRSIGFQVSDEGANEPVEADVLLGQDGLARGVRFVE